MFLSVCFLWNATIRVVIGLEAFSCGWTDTRTEAFTGVVYARLDEGVP